MSQSTSNSLLRAIAELRDLFPEWRFGQLVANLATAAGCQGPEAIWDVEDEQLLAAALRLIARNSGRGQAKRIRYKPSVFMCSNGFRQDLQW
jgi:hypothetical protein